MIDITLDARLFNQFASGALTPALTPLLSVAMVFGGLEDITAFDVDPVVTPTQLVYSDPTGTVTVFGRNFAQDADGDLTGTLDRITVVADGKTVLDVTLSASRLSLAAGTQSIVLDGSFPTDLASIQGFVGALLALGGGTPDAATRDALIAQLQPYALSLVTIANEGTVIGTLTPGTNVVTYASQGYTITFTGSFTQSVATLAELYFALQAGMEAGGIGAALVAMNDLASVDLTDVTMTDPSGTVLFDTTGTFTAVNGVVIDEVITPGTVGPDYYLSALADMLAPQTIRAELGDGDDRAVFSGSGRVTAVLDGSVPLTAQPQTTLQGGAGRDMLGIEDSESGLVSLSFGTGVLLGSTAPQQQPAQVYYDVRVFGFEMVEAEVTGRFTALGTAEAERLSVKQADGGYLFSADAGFDVLDLRYTEFEDTNFDDVTGITRAFFDQHFTIAPNGNGGHTITWNGTGGTGLPGVGTIVDVEAIYFLDPAAPAWGLIPLRALVSSDITLTPGADSFTGTFLDETINALAGNDVVDGGAGNDRILGDLGNDTIRGGDGTDTLNGGDGDDFIWGGATTADLRDVIYGGDGNDRIDAGYGNDLIYGGEGSDTVEGGFGVDEIIGQGGNDVLTGSAFSDLIFGGDGSDFINGGFGSDRVNGGAGADRFYHLGLADHGSDWIQDFRHADGDRLVYGGTGANIGQFQVNFATTTNAGDAAVQEAFVIWRPTGQILWALVDGGAQTSINIQFDGQLFDLLA